MTDAYDEPSGIAPRGTVLVAAGRGETAAAYQRFGRRIAADGYRVRVLPDVLADLGASLAEAGKLLVDDGLPGPHVVVGSDTGALFALALAARGAPGLDALVLAGLPVPRPPVTAGAEPLAVIAGAESPPVTAGVEPPPVTAGIEPPPVTAGAELLAVTAGIEPLPVTAGAEPPPVTAGAELPGRGAGVELPGWDAEVEARTACPNHRRVLGEGGAVRGALYSAQSPIKLIEYAGIPALPTLGLHGDADTISPLGEARAHYPGTLVAIAGGRHDVLNDVTHRTVAATVVLFLERLRLGADLPEIARVLG